MNERNIEIGKRIKKRREEMGLTQDDLGKALWLNKSTIQRYETGKIASIKLTILHAMAKVLNVSPDWLALKTDTMGEFMPVYSGYSDNLPTETDNVYFDFAKQAQEDGIDPQDIKMALEMIKKFKQKQ